ncbi:chaperonin 10-like protein [Umbelopsis sp. AD052]|nr:chaperonin 10-like protein [Umbelopsis sp. AD052]
MAQDNLSAFIYGPKDLRLENRDIEEPKKGEVQVNIRATGICGSDIHYYHAGRIGPRVLDPKKPMVLGHESSGIVTAVGEGVTKVKVGDRVALEPGRFCNKCERCKEGRYNLCYDMHFAGSLILGPNHGSLCRYACYPEHLCHPMSESMTYQDGALIEPLAVAVHSVGRTPVTQGSNALVFGAGPIGLLVAATVYAKGASQVTIFDINEHRLAFAKEYLPQIQTVQLPLPPKDTPDLLAWSQELIEKMVQDKTFDRELIDVCYECTGVDTCIQMAMYSARRGGVVMLIGLGKGSAMLPTEVMSVREVDVRGNFRYCHAYPEAIQLVSQGKVPLNGLVTHQFKLEDTLEAFDKVVKGGAGVVKVQIGDF